MSTVGQDKQMTEVRRRYRVADMMITMHSTLRDRYRRRSVALDSVIFSSSVLIAALAFGDRSLVEWLRLSSVLIAALAFGDRSLVEWLRLTTESTRLAIGTVAIVTFLASLMAWMVDWKGKADAHDRAASAYTSAKFRLAPIDASTGERDMEQVLLLYEEIARSTVPVPDSAFLKLKSEHLMKIRLSRLLDRSPGASIRCLKFRLRLRHTRKALDEAQDDM